MRDVYSDPATGAPATQPAGARVVFSTDGEREYDANGHYAIGPRLARPPMVRLIADSVGARGALSPEAARSQQAQRQRRARRGIAGYAALVAAIRSAA